MRKNKFWTRIERNPIGFCGNQPRTQYDTPGSIRGCPCNNCNHVRKIYEIPQLKSVIKYRFVLEIDILHWASYPWKQYEGRTFHHNWQAEDFIKKMNLPGAEAVTVRFQHIDHVEEK